MYLLRAETERTGIKSPSGILAALSVSNQVISVFGPTLGGVLIGLGGWHLIFAINVPLSLACLVLGALRLPKRVRAGHENVAPPSADVPGMLLFAGSLTAFMLFLTSPGRTHWYLPVIGAFAGGVFVRRELACGGPFIDLRVLSGNTPLLATYARQLLAYTVSYAFMYGYSQWLQEGRGLGPERAGLLLLPMSLMAIGVTVLTGHHAQVRGKLFVGGSAQLIGV
ncbi:Antiseptic resistance protein [Streptomyces hundungensis]|uniref:Antiseptic resistance protein n=1 Tax=Streptomyces hundungensis TaxID=1077946 RepID=A0A387HBZ4_9ACTN|nr:MFS transporter [Streptomyces hundungensis]AYG78148.1 Antiseptic resistance protein [Streptomyces hundungensis]